MPKKFRCLAEVENSVYQRKQKVKIKKGEMQRKPT